MRINCGYNTFIYSFSLQIFSKACALLKKIKELALNVFKCFGNNSTVPNKDRNFKRTDKNDLVFEKVEAQTKEIFGQLDEQPEIEQLEIEQLDEQPEIEQLDEQLEIKQPEKVEEENTGIYWQRQFDKFMNLDCGHDMENFQLAIKMMLDHPGITAVLFQHGFEENSLIQQLPSETISLLYDYIIEEKIKGGSNQSYLARITLIKQINAVQAKKLIEKYKDSENKDFIMAYHKYAIFLKEQDDDRKHQMANELLNYSILKQNDWENIFQLLDSMHLLWYMTFHILNKQQIAALCIVLEKKYQKGEGGGVGSLFYSNSIGNEAFKHNLEIMKELASKETIEVSPTQLSNHNPLYVPKNGQSLNPDVKNFLKRIGVDVDSKPKKTIMEL